MKMKNLKFILIQSIIILATMSVFSVYASPFKGVNETRLIIEDIDEEYAKCGITKSLIDAAVRIPLSSSKLEVTNRWVDNYVYANVNVRAMSATCAISISLQFRKYIPSQGAGTFWDASGLAVWAKNNAPTMVSNTLEGFTKELIGEWLKQNTK